MNHLESSFTGKNSFWRYIIMFATVLVASNTIGAIPLLIAYFKKTTADPSLIAKLAANPSDISILGYDPNLNLVLMLIPFLAGILTFIILVKPLNGRSFRQVLNGSSTIRWERIFVSGLVWAVLSAIYLFVYKGIDPSNFILNNTGPSLLVLAAIAIVLIPFQAGFEEVLFRGYLMQGLAVMFRNRWFPLILTSLFFGGMHAWNPEVKDFGFITMMPQYVLFGLIFGITTIYDDGIEIALGAHIANNIFNSIMVTNSSSVLQASALFVQKSVQPWLDFGGLLVASVIFFYVMKMIYKWDDLSIINKPVVKQEESAQAL